MAIKELSRGRFGRRASRDRRHVVDLGGDQAALRTGRVAAPGLGAWYRQAEPQLTGGLAGLKVEQRLAEIAKLGRDIPEFSGAAMMVPPGSPAVAPFDEKQAKGHQLRWSKQLKVPVEMANSIGMEFNLVPPGEFQMGSPPEYVAQMVADAKAQNLPDWYTQRLPCEAPRHRVRITKPFYLAMREVTQAEYERVMGDNPSRFKDNPACPVETVSWEEASAFCRQLSELPQEQAARSEYRLPTEAEWEWACRAGTATRWSGTDEEVALQERAWTGHNAEGRTHPVGQKTPNAWGFFDMHGNVWEWCQDWFSMDYYGTSPLDDPSGPATGSERVNRGGCFGDGGARCRASYRTGGGPGHRNVGLGFRVARSLPEKVTSGQQPRKAERAMWRRRQK